MNKLGVLLKELRKKENMSLKDVYKATGISDSKLNRIESGTNSKDASPSDLKALSKLYGVCLVELFRTAGYLDDDDLQLYQHTFQRVEYLTGDERTSIQTQINLFTKGREQV